MTRNKTRLHEQWCLSVVLRLCGPVRQDVAIRPVLRIDGVLFMAEPDLIWADLGGLICGRDLLIEHFSRSVTPKGFANCQQKISWAMEDYHRTPAKDRTKEPPLMVILSHSRPNKLLGMDLFEPWEVSGIFLQEGSNMAGSC